MDIEGSRPQPQPEEVDPSDPNAACDLADVSALVQIDGVNRIARPGDRADFDGGPDPAEHPDQVELTYSDVDIAGDEPKTSPG
jgi:hypothetical protein